MALSIIQNVSAIAYGGLNTSFVGIGGTGSLTYSVLTGGAGGTIDPSTGIYTSPLGIPTTPQTSVDTIQVEDSLSATATTTILIGTALELVCDIIQTEMNLDNGRVYLWDQKINEPTDNGLWIAVSMPLCKPFGNNISFDGTSGLQSNQVVNVVANIDIDILSRGPSARDQKEFVIMALNSVYSEQQQEANGFQISRLTTSFINLSQIDGAAIPYRYKISCRLNYAVTKSLAVPYFDTFEDPEITVNS